MMSVIAWLVMTDIVEKAISYYYNNKNHVNSKLTDLSFAGFKIHRWCISEERRIQQGASTEQV